MTLNKKAYLPIICGILVLSAFVTFFQIYANQQKIAKLNQEKVNDQKFTTYKNGAFQVNYPYWPPTNMQALIAVSNQGCTFIITKKDISVNPETTVVKNQYTVGKQTYILLFVAEKSVFESACRPFIDKTLASVKIK